MPTLPYRVVDVFTDRPFAGNPLAVVLGADGLPDADLQAIAGEFNLAETAFPLLPSEEERAAGADYRLRIFTPAHELPFAGHPSVGTAWVLAEAGRLRPGLVRQACAVGVLPLTVEPGPGRVELTGAAPVVGAVLPAAAVAATAGLAEGDVVDGVPARLAGTGHDFAYLLVRDGALDRIGAGRVDAGRLAQLGVTGGLSLSTWDPATRTARSRVFPLGMDGAEDAATGSAALGLGAAWVAAGLLAADGESAYTVLQGERIGRPSRLECTVTARAGRAVQCRVAGMVAPVASGEITVPPRH
ncbi:MAG: PhzF family phenazine biosynthesis protein [Frankiaceae bacterium]